MTSKGLLHYINLSSEWGGKQNVSCVSETTVGASKGCALHTDTDGHSPASRRTETRTGVPTSRIEQYNCSNFKLFKYGIPE
jgi:hypothetical protein